MSNNRSLVPANEDLWDEALSEATKADYYERKMKVYPTGEVKLVDRSIEYDEKEGNAVAREKKIYFTPQN